MNEALRQHVTRVGFDLALGKTHIAALVYMDVCIRAKVGILPRQGAAPVFNFFATGIRGCIDRGLVVHSFDQRWHNKPGNHMGRHYSITRAGRLVRDLLKEAGIWQEYEASLSLPQTEVVA